MEKNFTTAPDIPMGLGMALAQNIEAMNFFASLTPAQKQAVINYTHTISSKEEMQAYVDSLPKGGMLS